MVISHGLTIIKKQNKKPQHKERNLVAKKKLVMSVNEV